jgi:glycine/D-amino acid oxidase-like deaminating enzyme
MLHDAHGWWIAEAGPPPPRPALAEDVDADVVVIGGGFTGMWTAWHLLEADPDLRMVLLEADRCGFGPSGRNGGFVQAMTLSRPTLHELFGVRRGDELVAAA